MGPGTRAWTCAGKALLAAVLILVGARADAFAVATRRVWGREAALRHAEEGVAALLRGQFGLTQTSFNKALDADPSSEDIRAMRGRAREAVEVLMTLGGDGANPRRARRAMADYVENGDLSGAAQELLDTHEARNRLARTR